MQLLDAMVPGCDVGGERPSSTQRVNELTRRDLTK